MIVLTTTELRNLAAFADTQSKHRTYNIGRDTSHRLYVLNPDGRLWYVSSTVEAGHK